MMRVWHLSCLLMGMSISAEPLSLYSYATGIFLGLGALYVSRCAHRVTEWSIARYQGESRSMGTVGFNEIVSGLENEGRADQQAYSVLGMSDMRNQRRTRFLGGAAAELFFLGTMLFFARNAHNNKHELIIDLLIMADCMQHMKSINRAFSER